MPELSVVIPVGPGDTPYLPIRTLNYPAEIIVSDDPNGRGSNWARNQGADLVRTPLVLFCDADISWMPYAVERMVRALRDDEEAAFAFGSYRRGEELVGHGEWNPERLKQNNYISTMSVIRREWFAGWDTDIQRLQDWDAWLEIEEHGGYGVSVNQVLFHTEISDGITFGGGISWEDARRAVARKHGL